MNLNLLSIRMRKKLYLQFIDGFKSSLSTKLLRVESPSAEVQGHSKLQKTNSTKQK
jgi:DUF971 family protein